MFFRRHDKNGQSIVEYAVLFCVIIAALVIMQIYIKRSYQGRLKREADGLGPQYAPGHTASRTVSRISSNSITYTGGFTSTADNPSGGDPLVTTDGVAIETGTSVTVSRTNSTTATAERVDILASEL